MFKKMVIANRGEIAVRILRTCRDLGIETVALFGAAERDSLHVRLANECYAVTSPQRYGDKQEVLEIARACGADAIHPGYGFLAEEADFVEMCEAAGIAFIGPPAPVIAGLRNKVEMLDQVAQAGYPTPAHSACGFGSGDLAAVEAEAKRLGFPLVIKSCVGGRGRGERVINNVAQLAQNVGAAQREAAMIYGSDNMYLEKVIAPSHNIAVQIVADRHGNVVHLGEREGSVTRHNQKLVEESPAPCLTQEQRERLWETAVAIARLTRYEGVGTVEFLADKSGNFFFTEIKARIQIEHPVSEMLTDVDLVEQQIRIEAGEPLGFSQADVNLRGHAIQCRINAEDPWRNYLPSPGTLERFRLPAGMHVRTDTYGYVGCTIPVRYDSLLAKVVVWGETREQAIMRLRQALEDFKIAGVRTNLPLHLHILNDPEFVAGKYDTSFMWRHKFGVAAADAAMKRDLAAAAAVAYALRNDLSRPTQPARTQSGWHRASRNIPG